jgi:hypothetical protein
MDEKKERKKKGRGEKEGEKGKGDLVMVKREVKKESKRIKTK